MAVDCCLSVQGKNAFSADGASTITFHIHAVDKATAERVKEKLAKRANDLIETVEIREDGIRRLGRHLTSKITSLGASVVKVEIGMNTNCCKQHLDVFTARTCALY